MVVPGHRAYSALCAHFAELHLPFADHCVALQQDEAYGAGRLNSASTGCRPAVLPEVI
jgi:hypothetical protein